MLGQRVEHCTNLKVVHSQVQDSVEAQKINWKSDLREVDEKEVVFHV